MSILHSYLKEKNALQEKCRTIIFYNLGALVPWCLGGMIHEQLLENSLFYSKEYRKIAFVSRSVNNPNFSSRGMKYPV